MHMSCQTPHQLCDPKLVVSKLNSLNVTDITTPVSDRTLVGDLTESKWFCYVTRPLRGEFRFPCSLTVAPGSAAAGKQAPEVLVVVVCLFLCSFFFFFQKYLTKKKLKFNRFSLEALAEIRVPSHWVSYKDKTTFILSHKVLVP